MPKKRRNYCGRCDDYGHDALTHSPKLSKSVVRRLEVTRGENWWIDEEASPNGIGPVCFFCYKLIDWAPSDHDDECPVRNYINLNEEPRQWL